MINRILIGALSAGIVLASDAMQGCGVEGNVIDRRFDNGVYEVQVKDTLDQPVEDAPWISIDEADWDACNVGAQYPQCTESQ